MHERNAIMQHLPVFRSGFLLDLLWSCGKDKAVAKELKAPWGYHVTSIRAMMCQRVNWLLNHMMSIRAIGIRSCQAVWVGQDRVHGDFTWWDAKSLYRFLFEEGCFVLSMDREEYPPWKDCVQITYRALRVCTEGLCMWSCSLTVNIQTRLPCSLKCLSSQ